MKTSAHFAEPELTQYVLLHLEIIIFSLAKVKARVPWDKKIRRYGISFKQFPDGWEKYIPATRSVVSNQS